MEMTSTRVVNAPPDKVWKALNDPAVLKDAIPGCETLERTTDTEWHVVVAAKVGPVAARFNGKIGLADLAPPTSYTMRFEGQGGAAGFANGEAKVSLAPSGADATALSYTAKAQVGGKIAQLGSRLIDGAAAKMADEFFARFAERVAPAAVTAPSVSAPEEIPAPAARAGNRAMRYVALVFLAVLVGWLATRGLRI
ncbi:MAG TPA: carbon monoxide dehydrogenase subunit G [Casimicrobiaceae bacterium]|nr:carbon monoxide dehydrogenase subunit G [Casimicrobiaceae bacterium]